MKHLKDFNERFSFFKKKDDHITEQDLERVYDVVDMFAAENNLDQTVIWDKPGLKDPGEKRLNIYLNYLQEIIGDEYTHEVSETEYPPFDRREKKVYYAVFKKIKKFNESTNQTISFEEAKEWIIQNYSSDKVTEMFDEEVCSGNWVDKDQMEEEGYDSEYDYYIDYGHGEAEDAVKEEIINSLKLKFEIGFDILGDDTNLYDFLKDEYDCL